MSQSYDDHNIFARILRGEIPNDTVAETEHTLAFRDIAPKVPEHILVIPKGAYIDFDHFAAAASEVEIVDFTRVVGDICRRVGIAPSGGGQGYRLISNAGAHGIQEVAHMHIHIMGGRSIGPMVRTS